MSRVFRLPVDAMREVRVAVSRQVRVSNLHVPTRSLEKIISGPIDVRFLDIDQVDGNTTLLEQIVIVSLAKFHKVKKVFELGTFDGKTSANLSVNLGEDAEILTIDLPAVQAYSTKGNIEKSEVKYVLKDKSGEKFSNFANVFQHYGDTAAFDFSPWYGTRDMVFVDASHEHKYVLNDSEIALKLLRPGGIILWHDYGVWTGVARALNSYISNDVRFKQLVHVRDTTLCYLKTMGGFHNHQELI